MNILLAYNDTDVSNRALERAAQLAKLYEAKLVVTSVTPVVVGNAPSMEPGRSSSGGRAPARARASRPSSSRRSATSRPRSSRWPRCTTPA